MIVTKGDGKKRKRRYKRSAEARKRRHKVAKKYTVILKLKIICKFQFF